MVLGKLTKKIKKLSMNSRASGTDSDFTDDEDLGSISGTESSCSSETDSNKVPKDPRDRIVQKPKESESHYRVLTLKNGMQCLLISDAEEAKSESAAYRALEVSTTDKAAVCLTVRVGSAQEPHNLPGLAHFLEHMLFMGCKKYPDENEYDEYLDKHGGSSNASTDMERTSYLFDVSAEYLEGAIDRFAHQFIAPLLRKSSVKREVKAVDSEYMERLQSDTEKILAISQSMIQPNHPYHGFTHGNRGTLIVHPKRQNIDMLAELRRFYEEYYSANVMCLCIASSHPLKKLEKMAQVFEQIPNKKIPIPTLEKLPIPVARCNFIKYCPVKDKKKLIMSWFLAPQTQHFRSKPLEYVEFLLGHQGTGSLISALKHKGYATDILCESALGGFDSGTNFTRFILEITLSDTGLQDHRGVVKLVFQYIQMLRKQLPCERIFNEMKTMMDIDFDNMEAEDPYSKVEDLAENMAIFPPEHYLNGPEQVFEYKPDLIMDLVNSLTPDRMFVVLQSRTFEDVCKTTEKWFKGVYCEGNFEPDFIDSLKTASPKILPLFKSEFKLPEPNKYIPEDFEMKDVDVEGSVPFPVVITDEPSHKVWFHNDEVFEDPECMIYLHLFSKRVCENVRTYALNCLYVELYCNRVAELFFCAGLAGLTSTVEVEREGFRLCYDGYSDKMFKYFKATLEEFFNASANTFNFTAVKDSIVKRLRMNKLKPKKCAEDIRHTFLRKTHVTCEEMAAAMDQITAEDIKHHEIASMGGFYLEVFCSGNMTSQEVEDYIKCFSKKLGLTKDVMKEDQFRQERVYKFPLGRHVHRIKNNNPEDVNTVVVNYYQHDVVSFRDGVILAVLEGLMTEPFFNQLRTRLQMGYSVELENHLTFGMTGFSLAVHTQANKFSAKEANIYLETFLSWFTQYLNAMDEKSFEDRIAEMIKDKVSPTLAMDDEINLMWAEILIQEYIFDRDQRVAEVMKKLTKGEMISFCYNLFFRNVRKLSVQVEGNPKGTSSTSDENREGEESDDESSASENSAPKTDSSVPNMTLLSKSAIAEWGEELKTVQSAEEFHKECKLSPVYKMVTKVVTVDVTNKVN